MKHCPRCLVVTQAGTGVGLGHLMRSMVAARSLHNQLKAEIHFLIQGDAVNPAILHDITFELISKQNDLSQTIKNTVQTFKPDVMIMDLFGPWIPNSLLKTLEQLQGRVKMIAIDALQGCLHHVDMLFVPSFLKPQRTVDAPKKTVFGWDCFLLNIDPPKPPLLIPTSVLVLTGGSDATGLGQSWPTLLNNALVQGCKVDWVTGPFAQPPVWPHHPNIHITNHQAPQGLSQLMQQASYALTVYGVSFYELLYWGVPTVVFSPYGNKDNTELNAIQEEGVAWVASSKEHAVELLSQLMANSKVSATLGQKAKQKLHKHGGQRFVDEVEKLL